MKSSIRRQILIFSAVYAVLAIGLCCAAAFFGRSLVQAWDAFDQHYPNMIYMSRFYREVLSNIFHGNFSIPTYDLTLGDGQSILYTLYFYGLADPLNFPSAFFSTEHVIYYYSFTLLLRPSLAGLAFLFLCKTKGHTGAEILAGAFLYILSGFGLYAMSVHPFFVNAMIGLPCLIMGFDRVFEHRSPALFILTITMLALQGFYFTYMVSFMVVIYALFCIFSVRPIREGLLTFARCIGYYLIGLSMAMFVFLPGIIGFLQSNRGSAANEYSLLFYELDTIRYKLTNLISIRYDDDVVAMPAIALLSLIGLFGKNSRKAGKENRRLAILTVLAFLCYFLPAPSVVLNGGNVYPRHVFGLILCISYATVCMIPQLAEGSHLTKAQKVAFPLLVVLLLANGVLYKGHTRMQLAGIGLWTVEAAAVGLVIYCPLRVLREGTPESRKKLTGLLSGFTIICMLANAALVAPELLYTMRVWNPLDEFEASAPAVAGSYLKENANSSEETASGFMGRVDADDKDCYFYNVGTALELSTTRTYTSLLPAAQSQMWWDFALTSGNNGYSVYGLDSRTILETLAGVTTFATGTDGPYRVPYGFAPAATSSDGEKLIYQNEYPLSLGYVYSKKIEEKIWTAADSVEKTDMILQGIYLEEDARDTFSGAAADILDGMEAAAIVNHSNIHDLTLECGEGASYENGILTITKPGAKVTITFEGEANAETYLRLQDIYTLDAMTGSVVTETGEAIYLYLVSAKDIHYFGRRENVYNLGYSSEAQNTVQLCFQSTGTAAIGKIEIETLSMSDYQEEVAALSQSMLHVTSTDGCVLQGEIDVKEAGVLTLSIPYMKGYTLCIDGKETEYVCGNVWYVSAPIAEGMHTIEVYYRNPGQTAANILTLLGLAAFISIMSIHTLRKRNNNR